MTGPSRLSFRESIHAAGSGLREEHIDEEDGLRCRSIQLGSLSSFTAVSGTTTTIGAGGGADVTTWTSLVTGSWAGRMPIAMTPSAFLIVLNANSQIRLRARGYDQFGSYIMEVTPWVALTAGASNALHLINFSKVFSYVDRVDYQSIGIDSASAVAGIGLSMIIDPDRVENASIGDAGNGPMLLYNTEDNWGVATPVRVSPYSNHPVPEFEVLGAAIVNANDDQARSVLLPYEAGRSFGAFSSAGYRVGRSLAGWQGTPHKIGFRSDDWSTDKLPVETGGSSTFASDTPTLIGEIGVDWLRLFFWVRSALGTRRDHNPTSVYATG